MKNYLLPFFLLVFSFQNAVAQTPESHALNYQASGTNLNQIADDLARPFQSESDKALAIFVWITDNIRYDYKKSINPKDIRISYRTEAEHERKLAALLKKQLDRTLKLKKGICEDYSQLFKTLCERVGIESEIVVGHARNHPDLVGKIPRVEDHAWNAVNLDGSWYLADATWGAGTIDGRGIFEKDVRTEYFKVRPKDFIKSHFPKENKWQLLSQEIDSREFSEIPMGGFGYLKYGVEDYYPKNTFLNSRSNKVRFKLKLTENFEGKFLLFENTKGQQIFPKTENGYLVFDYGLKGKRGKVITLAVVEGTDVYDILSYKVR